MSAGGHRVEVALPLPVNHTFTYTVEGAGIPEPGSRVLVPFRRDRRIGWVVGPGGGERKEGLRAVLGVLDERPSLPPDLLELSRWISRYYLCPLGLTLKVAFSTNYLETIKMMVSVGLGWSLLPSIMVDRELTALALEGFQVQRTLGVVRHTGRTLSNAGAAILSIVQQQT